ncbi:hypothetical protein B0T17DRAFT_486797 [Bombardia bombarda]|uniref:Uncharacterized protein n=1 Tax=Bombardia bombarda TaxID=252184 RepID=A0AA40C914_9PEZI|nr:hypothetical protein B0T17DRAFT_486797 [Bombardia bombarda]
MMGLAASHLTLYGRAECAPHALAHRVKAIKALNDALSRPCASRAEGDARFATIMALTFQASCMPEGMTEFLAMIRGCHVIARTAMGGHGEGKDRGVQFEESLFSSFVEEGGYYDNVWSLSEPSRLVLQRENVGLLMEEAVASLRALAPLCGSRLEVEFLVSLERVAKMVKASAVQAFADLSDQYGMLSRAANPDFAAFTDPDNHATQLILIHFNLIEFHIGHLALGGAARNRFAFRRRTCLAWTDRLCRTLPERYRRPYLDWPIKYCTGMAEWLPRLPDELYPAARGLDGSVGAGRRQLTSS